MKHGFGFGLVTAAVLLRAAAGHAHSLAGTTVSVEVIRPETVTVTIAAEADPLIAKLETLSGAVTFALPLTLADRRTRLESLFPFLRTHIDARIDGTPLAFELHDIAVDDTHVEIRLTASIPAGPRMFTWRSTFMFGAYQMAVTSGDDQIVEWLQGPQTSTPRALAPPRAAADAAASGLTRHRIGPSLTMSALVVFFLYRRAMAQRPTGG